MFFRLKTIKIAAFSLFPGILFSSFRHFNQEPTQKTSWVFSSLKEDLDETLRTIAKNLDISVNESQNVKKNEVFARNALNEEKIMPLEDYEDLNNLLRFSNPPKTVKREEIMEILVRLPENERVYMGFFAQNTNISSFNERKYKDHDCFSHYYILDEEGKVDFNLAEGDVILVKPAKIWEESQENLLEVNGRRFLFEKKTGEEGFSDELLKVVSTDNEVLNIMRVNSEKGRQKFLIYQPIEKNDKGLEAKVMKKLGELAEKENLTVIYTKNEGLLTNYVK